MLETVVFGVVAIGLIAPVIVPISILFYSGVRGHQRYAEWLKVKTPAHPLNSPSLFRNLSIFARLLVLQGGGDVPRKLAGCANWLRICLLYFVAFYLAVHYLQAHPDALNSWGLFGDLIMFAYGNKPL